VAPDDQNCAPSTVVSYALQPGHGPVYYPTTADVNCLYAQILRHVKGAGPLLRKGFYVSPAQHVPSILRDFTGGLGFLVRQATGLVGVGENALAVGEEVAGPARVIMSAPQVVGAAVLATALYIVTDPATPVGEDTAERRGVRYLYHYTFADRIKSILASGLNASDPANGDAQFGPGQYLTDLTPEESQTLTRFQHSAALFKIPFNWNRGQAYPPYSPVGWIRIDVDHPTSLFAVRVAPLFSSRFPGRSIFLVPGTARLPLANRERGTGTLIFRPGRSGLQYKGTPFA